jgi:hypothetical protein
LSMGLTSTPETDRVIGRGDFVSSEATTKRVAGTSLKMVLLRSRPTGPMGESSSSRCELRRRIRGGRFNEGDVVSWGPWAEFGRDCEDGGRDVLLRMKDEAVGVVLSSSVPSLLRLAEGEDADGTLDDRPPSRSLLVEI